MEPGLCTIITLLTFLAGLILAGLILALVVLTASLTYTRRSPQATKEHIRQISNQAQQEIKQTAEAYLDQAMNLIHKKE